MAMKIDCRVVRKVTTLINFEDFISCLRIGCDFATFYG